MSVIGKETVLAPLLGDIAEQLGKLSHAPERQMAIVVQHLAETLSDVMEPCSDFPSLVRVIRGEERKMIAALDIARGSVASRIRREMRQLPEIASDSKKAHQHDLTVDLKGEPMLPSRARLVDVSHRPLFPDRPITADTIRQGENGDCGLVGPLCALAHAEPETLLALVRFEGGSAVVQRPGSPPIIMRPTLPVDVNGREIFAHCADSEATFVGFIEKAFALTYGGHYPGVLTQVTTLDAFRWLTGTVSDAPLWNVKDDWLTSRLEDAFDQPTTAWVPFITRYHPARGVAERYGVILDQAHIYTVLGYVDDAVLLHDPFGRRHPDPMPLDAFRRIFDLLHWVDRRMPSSRRPP